MTRAPLTALCLLVSITAPAAAQMTRADPDRSASLSAASREATGSLAPSVFGDLSTAVEQTQAPPPPLGTGGPRRRGSMVGYIEDPVVSSKVRVRFDVARHSHTPDRAEFFYAKCGCYRDLPVTNAAYDPNAAGPGPGIVSDLNFQQFYIEGEYAATDRFSVFGELPLRWLQPQTGGTFGKQSGVSDLRAGVKLALTDTPEQMLTAQVKTFLQTGDSRRGLGTDHASVEPAIVYYQQVSDRAAVESQVAVWIPFGGSKGVPTSVKDDFAGNVLSYGIGPSYDVYSSGDVRVTPVVELVGWRVLSGYQTAAVSKAGGTNIVNLKFGARASWGRGASIYAGYGRALTDADWYNDIFRFEYRFSF
jgi:hypothetical protein